MAKRTQTTAAGRRATERRAPTCFVSYSTGESHVRLLLECIEILFKGFYNVMRTPSELQSGTSQRDQITKLIAKCSFGIVILDGLRPNVVFEYGILHGMRKPVILLKEARARVDLRNLLGDTADLGVAPVELNLDRHFSDVKDVNYAEWKRYELRSTVRTIWSEHQRKRQEISGFREIPEPTL